MGLLTNRYPNATPMIAVPVLTFSPVSPAGQAQLCAESAGRGAVPVRVGDVHAAGDRPTEGRPRAGEAAIRAGAQGVSENQLVFLPVGHE